MVGRSSEPSTVLTFEQIEDAAAPRKRTASPAAFKPFAGGHVPQLLATVQQECQGKPQQAHNNCDNQLS